MLVWVVAGGGLSENRRRDMLLSGGKSRVREPR